MKYQVQLEIYKGPLDLLLKRVTREELPVEQISVCTVIDQFVEYLSEIAVYDIEEGSRFMYLAAALLAVKARLLLPCHEGEEKEDDAPDDQYGEGLIESDFNEYLAFREAAASLNERAIKWRMTHRRPIMRQKVPGDTRGDLDCLVKAFQGVLERISTLPEPYVVEGLSFNIDDVMDDLLTRIQSCPEGLSFNDIFNTIAEREEVIITFLAILELIYQGKVNVRQLDADEMLLVSS